MARTTMADIITLVRGFINDPSAAVFTDDDVQSALDARRLEVRYGKLGEEPTISANGSVTFVTFRAPWGVWELPGTDTPKRFQLVDQGFNDLSASLTDSDYYTGRWVFNAQPRYPVMVTGFTYDAYGAAADLLRRWAAKVVLDFDVKADGTELSRSQKRAALLDMANEYLKRARVRHAALVRTDGTQDPHITYDDGYPNERVNP